MLIHEKNPIRLERITNIETCMNNYNWESITSPPGLKEWIRLKKNNPSVSSVLSWGRKKSRKRASLSFQMKFVKSISGYVTMNSNDEKQHFLATKSL